MCFKMKFFNGDMDVDCTMVRNIFLILLTFPAKMLGQTMVTEDNHCHISILTDLHEYEFTSSCMTARLNHDYGRFEFIIPRNTVSSPDPDVASILLDNLTAGEDIVIYALFPDNEDCDFGLSYFKDLGSAQLTGLLQMGQMVFNTDVRLDKIRLLGDHHILFDFGFLIYTRSAPLSLLRKNQVIQIRVEASDVRVIDKLILRN